MSRYRDLVVQDLRLVMLRLLSDAGAYTSNAYVIGRKLDAEGHHESSDSVRTQLSWLQEQGLVQLVDEAPLLVATLTERGLDVAQGRVQQPGVQRPRPGA